jgi:hypothetical protein
MAVFINLDESAQFDFKDKPSRMMKVHSAQQAITVGRIFVSKVSMMLRRDE